MHYRKGQSVVRVLFPFHVLPGTMLLSGQYALLSYLYSYLLSFSKFLYENKIKKQIVQQCHEIFSNSTSNISVEYAGMGPLVRVPYPMV